MVGGENGFVPAQPLDQINQTVIRRKRDKDDKITVVSVLQANGQARFTIGGVDGRG